MRDELKKSGNANCYKKMQIPRPNIDNFLINSKIEWYWGYTENSGKIIKLWCKGLVVGAMKNNQVHIEWDKEYVWPGDRKVARKK